MNELKIFDEREVLGKAFRIYGTPDEPLFLAKDVAEWIDYSKTSKGSYDVSRMLNAIDEQEKLVRTIFVSGQNREMWFLTEDGLYEVLMQSRKPIAKSFKKEVKKILKTIRKTGGYIPVTPEMSETEILSRAVLICKRTIDEQEKQIAFEQSKNIQLSKELAQARPAAQFALECLDSPALFTTEQIAKDYGLSARALNQKLNLFGVQYKRSGQWLLYARYADQGLTHSKTQKIKHSDGSVEYKMYTCWTAKGRKFIHELLRTHSVVYSQPLTEIFD